MYGGRAIDNFDRRVLNTYMNEYMGDFIFDKFQPFHFFANEKADYFIPTLQPENDGVPKEMFLGKNIFLNSHTTTHRIQNTENKIIKCNNNYYFKYIKYSLKIHAGVSKDRNKL